MRKILLSFLLCTFALSVIAQTFSEPQVGKRYKIKGDHASLCWLTPELSGSSIKVSSNEAEAAIFERTENGFRVVSTGKYLGMNGNVISYVSEEKSVTIHNTYPQSNNEGKYAIKVQTDWLYNNSTVQSPITHESAGWITNIERFWGFVEVPVEEGKYYKLDTYKDFLWAKTDGTSDLLSTAATADTRALWQFVETDKVGVYNIKNAHTGLYVGKNAKMTDDLNNYGRFQLTIQNNENGVKTAQDGCYFIKFEGNNEYNCLHSAGEVVKPWTGAGLGNQYEITEVDDFAHTLIVGDLGYSSLILGFNAKIPEFNGEENGVFIATESETAGYVHLTPVTGVLPANTAVIVKAPKGEYEFKYTTDTPSTIDGNLLEGTLYNKEISGPAYVLANGEGGVGLYNAKLTSNKFLNNANKIYLPASKVTQGAATFCGFDWDGVTGIDQIVDSKVENDYIYDLSGRRLNNITNAGVYIINGKKVMVK